MSRMNNDSQKNTLVLLAGLALIVLSAFAAIGFVNEMIAEPDFIVQANRKVAVDGTLKYRFMRVYSGPDISTISTTQRGGAPAVGQLPSTRGAGAATYHHTTPSASASARPMVGHSSATYSGGAVLPTQSSATMSTYGGGSGSGVAGSGVVSGRGRGSSVTYSGGGYATAPVMAMSARKPNTSTMTYANVSPVAEEEPVVASVGPRRTGSYGDYEEGDDYTVGAETHPLGYQKTDPITGVVSKWTTDGWVAVSDVTEVNGPIGDTPWLLMLLLLAGYAAFAATRRKEA